MNDFIDLLKKLFGDNPLVIGGAIIGGFGILNVIDSLIGEWGFIFDWLRPIFTLIRDLWRPLIDKVALYLSLRVSDPVKDYMLMGCIVVGMRLRSSMVIWRGLNDQKLTSYPQRTLFRNHPIVLRKGESFKFYGLFLPIRLSWAFIAWPPKVFGAAWRYGRGTWDKGFSGQEARETRQEQYLIFFGAIFWALFFLMISLLIQS